MFEKFLEALFGHGECTVTVVCDAVYGIIDVFDVFCNGCYGMTRLLMERLPILRLLCMYREPLVSLELDVVRTVIVHHEMYECLDRRNVIEVLSVLVVCHQV